MNKQIIVKDLLISYWENAGTNNSQALLFLHGWRSNKEVWGRIIENIKGLNIEGLGIYAVDLPGFGGSQLPRQPMTVGDYAEVVYEFIKKLELHNVILVGHSFGGRVAIKLAASHPELAGKLLLADSAGFAAQGSKKKLMGMAAKIVRPFFKPSFMQPLRKKIYQRIGAEDYVATPELRQTFVNIVGEDLTEDMKKIICPTLIIAGADDRETPISYGQRMNFLIPNSEFLILPGAGHFSFIDKPEEFVNELKNFIV